jgi:hypothetical protein
MAIQNAASQYKEVHMRLITYIAALALLSACSKQYMLQKFSTPEDQQVAKGYIDSLRSRNFETIKAALDPSMQRADVPQLLAKMADMVPEQSPTSITLVGAQSMSSPGVKRVNTTFQYQFGNKWLLINVATQLKNGSKTIVGFNVVPEAQSLDEQNHFTLHGKTALEYSVLALAILVPLFTIYALVVCIRTRFQGKKWPWVLFIIFGLGRLSVNWSTGAWGLSVAYAQLFGASAFSQLYGPMIISVSVPSGALAFLLFGRKRAMRGTATSGE